MQVHELAWSTLSLNKVPWAYMNFHELAWSYMSLHAVTWACMQFLSLSEHLTRISQCLFWIVLTSLSPGLVRRRSCLSSSTSAGQWSPRSWPPAHPWGSGAPRTCPGPPPAWRKPWHERIGQIDTLRNVTFQIFSICMSVFYLDEILPHENLL